MKTNWELIEQRENEKTRELQMKKQEEKREMEETVTSMWRSEIEEANEVEVEVAEKWKEKSRSKLTK